MGHDYTTTLGDVRAALRFLDCTDRMTWVKAAFAIKNEYADAGFGEWDDWSQGDKRYKANEARLVWRGAGVTGKVGTMGIGSLFAMAMAAGYKPDQKTLTPEQREQLRLEHEARRENVLQQQALDAAWCKKMADVVAAAASDIVQHHLTPAGGCPYIGKKRITPYGALFPREPLILIVDTKNECSRVIVGRDATRDYWAYRKTEAGKAAQEHEFSLSINKGCLVLPACTMQGAVRNLQVITRAKEGAPKKLFIKCGEKTGTYLKLGNGQGAQLVCEGWATGCTLHKAAGLPVWVTWDCGGMYNFAVEMASDQQAGQFIFCGDDDAATDGNPGKTKAEAAAALLGGLAVLPRFPSHLPAAIERSDFNDLQLACGLNEVAQQMNAAVLQLQAPPVMPVGGDGFYNSDAPPLSIYDDYDLPAANEPTPLPPAPDLMLPPDLDGCFKRYALIADTDQGKVWDSYQQKILKQKAVKDFVTPDVFKAWLNDTEKRRTTTLGSVLPLAQKKTAAVELGGGGLREALNRYVYLNPSQNVWDTQERQVVAVNDLRIAIASCYSDWVQHPERQEIKAANLVFDPKQKTPVEGHINRFTGLPLVPARNDDKCENIKRLMLALCNHDRSVAHWLACWLAYPLQNVGAKMQTAVLMHSDVHGSGKSYFFDGVMRAIYGKYCRTLGQTQLESQYNDWQSELLFGVFEEVLPGRQKYGYTGTLKQIVTSKQFRVEKKFMSGWEEANHMNAVFLSNEVQPLPIEPSDRRFLVVWPELKLIDELKNGVNAELENGGAEAFYAFLLDYPLKQFNEYTEPPITEAKTRIIEHGKSTWERFYDEWKSGELEYPYCSVRVKDLFRAYDRYCSQRRESYMGQGKFISFIHSKERKKQTDVNFDNGRKKGKATFLVVGECPPNFTKQIWLANCVEGWERILNKHANEDSFAQAS